RAALADLNGDGHLDLVVAVPAANSVAIAMGVGDGTFGPFTYLGIGDQPGGIALGDVNGDARVDLVVSGTNTNVVKVMLGDGAGGFGTAVDFPVGVFPLGVVMADMNGDGRLDIVTVNQFGESASILFNTFVNRPPTANAQSVSVPAHGSVPITL